MPQSSAKPFSGIFVSYRRDDSPGHAGRLSDKLRERFGQDHIFMDIDNIQPGEDFGQAIERAVGSCEILIAIIGRHWLAKAGETSRLLDNPSDFVRLEIATALNRDIRVIPVLVQRATMPAPQDLPDDLKKLALRNAFELTDIRWQRDVDQLTDAIEKIRGEYGGFRINMPVELHPEPVPRPSRRRMTLFIVAVTFIVATVVAVVLFNKRSLPPIDSPDSAAVQTTPSPNESGQRSEPTPSMTAVKHDPTKEENVAKETDSFSDDVATGFLVERNPNAVWSYGYLSVGNVPDTKTFRAFEYGGSAYDFFGNQGLAGIFTWRIALKPGTPSGHDSGLCVYKNVSSQLVSLSPNAMLEPNQVSLHPGFGGFFSVIRWSAPKTKIYVMTAEFKGLDRKPTTTDVHIYKDDEELWSDYVDDYQRPHQFSTKLSVKKGDLIYFIVGYGRDKEIWNDTTALAARIHPLN